MNKMQQLSLFDLPIEEFNIHDIEKLHNDNFTMRFKKAMIEMYEKRELRTKENFNLIRNFVEKYKDIFRDYPKMKDLIDLLESESV